MSAHNFNEKLGFFNDKQVDTSCLELMVAIISDCS